MPKLKIFLISVIGFSIFNSAVLLVIGITLTSSPDLIGVDPERQKNSQIVSFVTAGIHIMISSACGLYTYRMKR